MRGRALLLVVACSTAAWADIRNHASPAQPVTELLNRVLGEEAAAIFELSLDTSMPQGFRLANVNAGSAGQLDQDHAQELLNPLISVTASGLPELAYGAGYYLRTHAHMSFSWVRTGGNQVAAPSGGFPALKAPISIAKKAKWSYYQNVCTGSYSMWWWDWSRWEKELDWAALWGVNLVLAYTGQEQIFKQVYNSIGVNDSILNKTFDGPAFLTWSRGQGNALDPLGDGTYFGFGTDGPLPGYFMASQHALNVKIMDRLRLLGMKGILPGFQGNVPLAMPELFPHANTSGGWVDALDPLFDTIAKGVADGMQRDFGPADFIEADGWFSLETGPWYASSMGAQAPDMAERGLAAPSIGHLLSEEQAEQQRARQTDASFAALVGYAANLSRSEGGEDVVAPCTVSKPFFIVPTEEEAYSRAVKVFASLTQASPDATWVYQGYPWFRVYATCPQSRPALRAFVRGFTRAIPQDKLLVLDLVADSPGRAIWAYPPDAVTKQPFAQNASLIWCALANWGGAVHIGGDLSYVLDQTRMFFGSPNAKGVGLTPEGIDNSPAYYSLVLDSPWTPQPTAESWFAEWGRGRCGKAGVTAAERAYELLFQSVYRPGKPYLWCCSNPVFCPTALPGTHAAQPDYNTTLLRRALELMVEAAPDCPTASFRYDLVDVAREWLSMTPCLDLLAKVNASAPPAQLKAQVAALLELYADVDSMMATDEGFLLGAWLNNSRAVADWDGSAGALAGFYEWNSRVQITTWAGGYSRREWSGMISGGAAEARGVANSSGYYSGRLNIWLKNALESQSPTAHLVAGTAYAAVKDYDCNYFDGPRMANQCHGKAQSTCVSILESLCDKDTSCIGFNYPGCIFKTACPACEVQKPGCRGWEPTTKSTMYFKPGHGPPHTTSSCGADGFCHASHGPRSHYNGTACQGHCPTKPPPPPLSDQLAAYAKGWNLRTWDPVLLPATAVGDAVATAKHMLNKWKN